MSFESAAATIDALSTDSDYYALLGLSRGCDEQSIKRAYRSAARRLHPDLPSNRGSREAAREFHQVREAYEVLQDPERRRRYDLYGRDGGVFGSVSGATPRGTAPDFNLHTRAGEGVASIFEDLFAVDESIKAQTQRRARSPWNPSDLGAMSPEDMPSSSGYGSSAEAKTSANPSGHRFGFDPEALAEAALAGDLASADRMTARIEGKRTEPRLSPSPGPISVPDNDIVAGSDAVAPLTGDQLRVSVKVPFLTAAVGGPYSVSYRVPGPDGEWMLEEFDIAVPPGTHSGMESRCGARGHFGVGGGARGDVVLELLVGEHPWFRRVGADVYLDLPLSLGEAAAGCQIEVPTVRGQVTARIPPGVRSGQQIRLRGQGIDSGSSRGHQVLCVQVQVPRGLREEHIEALRKIDEETGYDPRAAIWMDDESGEP